MKLFVDANVLLYANAADPQLAEPCLAILRAIAEGSVDGYTSVAVIEELWHLELRGRVGGLAGSTHDAYELFRPLLAVTDEIVAGALALPVHALGANDRIHAATCHRYDLRMIVTADADFDAVDDLDRLDPSDSDAVAQLLRAPGATAP